jgi:predicted amidohydrolase
MIRTSLVQFDAEPLAARHNLSRMAEFVRAEAAAGADLIVFPELSNTGSVEPLEPGAPMVTKVPHFGEALWQACAEPAGQETNGFLALCADLGVHVVAGLGLRDPRIAGAMRNASMLMGPEGLIGCYIKVHQWQTEKLYFTAGDEIATFPALGQRIGMQICYDSCFPEITRILALQGAGIVTSIWASFDAEDAPLADEALFIHRAYTRARENGIFFLSCNRAGRHGGHRFYGRSCVVAPNGAVLGALTHDREDVLRAEIDPSEIVRYRSSTGIWSDRAPEVYARALARLDDRT